MFPCSGCGACCQHISGISELSDFDRGDGVCCHYDSFSRACHVYDQRPEICSIERRFWNLC